MSQPQLERNAQMAQQLAMGASQSEIANRYGIHQTRVSQIASTALARAIIDRVQQQVIDSMAEPAAQNMIATIGYRKGLAGEDANIDLIKERNKYSAKVLESIGALASHTQAQIVTNIYQQHNEIHLSDTDKVALAHLGLDVIEGELVSTDIPLNQD